MRVKKLLCSILVICMMLSTMGTAVFAKPASPVAPAEEEISIIDIEESGDVAEVAGVGYATIQDAINAASKGDTVTIAAGEYRGFDISNKEITIQGTVGDDGELLTTIKGGNPAITGHGFNGTIKDLKIKDTFKVMYAEPVKNVTIDNVHIAGATYGFHLVAYTTGITWTIQNSYMDLSWANSFGVYDGGYADIIIRNNKFDTTNPYYPEYGALAVNTFSPSVTVEDNIFGEGARIYIDASVSDTSDINIGANYYADGVENAFADDSDGVTVEINSYYADVKENNELTGLVDTTKTYVASIKNENGDVTYCETLKAAIEDASEGDTIYVLNDIEIAADANVAINGVNIIVMDDVVVTNNGTIDVFGEATIVIPALQGEGDFNLQDGATLVDSAIAGSVFVAGNVTFDGKNSFKMIYDFGTLTDYYGTTANMEWTVTEGSSVTLTDKSRYGLGYGDNVTINGTISNALTARNNLSIDDASLFMHGMVAQESKGWNCNSVFTANDAYVIIGENNSFGNKPGNYGGTYTFNINNTVLDASRITFYEALSKTTFNITNSDVKMGTFMTRDADSVFTISDSKVLSTTTTNGNDEGNYNAGTLNLINSDLVYSAPVVNTGKIVVDTNSSITAPSISGTGVIEVDVSNYSGYGDLESVINADLSGFTGEVKAIGGDAAKVTLVDGKLVFEVKPVGGPIIAYTDSTRIWGETKANAKSSYEIAIYSDETYMGKTSLNNINGIINGNVNVTWSIKLDTSSNGADGYWSMVWDVVPSINYQPTHAALIVDGVEVSRSAIQLNGPDGLNKIYAVITDADGKILSYQTSLDKAIANAKNDEIVVLIKDIALDAPITVNKDVNIDGNGHKITQSKKCKNEHALIYFDGADVLDVNIKNLIFDGIKGGAAIRTLGANMNIDNCVFQNCEHTQVQGLVRLTQGSATIKDSKFINNNCSMVVSYNYDTNGLAGDKLAIDNCEFEGNTASSTAIVYYVKGDACTITNSEFRNNKVSCTNNGATVYLGFQENCTIKKCLFKNNNVVDSSDSKRVAGAIFFGYDADIAENVFEGNTATNANGDDLGQHVCTSTYYDCEINLNNNYFDGEEPVEGKHYFIQHKNGDGTFNLEEYYREYSIDADGNLVLADLKPIVSKIVAVQYVENNELSDADNGLKVYDIVIVAKDEHIINRLNAADLTFANSSDKVAYEIVAAENITLTHNSDYPNRYMFNFDGKTDVKDTDVALTIGCVRFTGYDSFTFNVVETVETNLITATTLDDNIVSYYAADGLSLNTDVDGDGSYLGIIETEIKVPVRTLTINIDFPNAIRDNKLAYQDMKVEITGTIDGVQKTVTHNLGKGEWEMNEEGSYVVTEDSLVLNNAYTVTVSGAGYRTARYTVTMTEDKALKFWNNVMDEAQVVEIGKDSSAVNVTFLAGDIVKDNKINIYDLSAVVSYFGQTNDTLAYSSYAKYDLNRDGVIDSKDVAYVLVSWDN